MGRALRRDRNPRAQAWCIIRREPYREPEGEADAELPRYRIPRRSALHSAGRGPGCSLAVGVQAHTLWLVHLHERPANGARPRRNRRHQHGAEALYDEAQKQAWVIISMKNDWKRIFAFD
jgi:hypothetical protein